MSLTKNDLQALLDSSDPINKLYLSSFTSPSFPFYWMYGLPNFPKPPRKKIKVHYECPEAKKENIKKWIYEIDDETRFKLFTLDNPLFVNIMLKLYLRKIWTNEEFLAFKSEESLISQYFPPGKEGDIDLIFKFRKNIDSIDDKHATKQEKFFKFLRVSGIETPYDAFCFDWKIIQDPSSLLELLEDLTSNKLFLSDHNNMMENSLWFNPTTYQTIAAWIVNQIERRIIKVYQKWLKKDNFLEEERNIIDQTKNLQEMWDALSKNAKKKCLSEAKSRTLIECKKVQNNHSYKHITLNLFYSNEQMKECMQFLPEEEWKKLLEKSGIEEKFLSSDLYVLKMEDLGNVVSNQGNMGLILSSESLIELINKEHSAQSAKKLLESVEKDEGKPSKKPKRKNKKKKGKSKLLQPISPEKRKENTELVSSLLINFLDGLPLEKSSGKKKAKSECKSKKSKKKSKGDKAFKCFDIQPTITKKKSKQKKSFDTPQKETPSLRKVSSSKKEETKVIERKISIDSIIDHSIKPYSEKKLSVDETNESSDFYGIENDNFSFLKRIQFGICGHSEFLPSYKIEISNEIHEIVQEKVFEKLTYDFNEMVGKIINEKKSIQAYKNIIYNRLDIVVKHLFRETYVMTQVYGSCSTGLDICHSDLDILIVGFSEFECYQVHSILQKLADCLSNYEWITSVLNLSEATVPILKLKINPTVPFKNLVRPCFLMTLLEQYSSFIELDTNEEQKDISINVDISVITINSNIAPNMGMMTTSKISEWLNHYEPLYPIVLIIKYFLWTKEWNVPYNEGLGSYAVVILVRAYLSLHNLEKENNIGKVFYNMLKFFGKDFNRLENGMAFENEKAFLFPIPQYNQGKKLTLIDPLNPGYNITHKAEKISDIFSKFSEFQDKIDSLMRNLDEYLSIKLENERNNLSYRCKMKFKEELFEGFHQAENLIEKFIKHQF